MLEELVWVSEMVYDLKINYSMFTRGLYNFTQIFLYSDNYSLLLKTALFYLNFYKHAGAALYEMPPED